jgi:hypothetical protein
MLRTVFLVATSVFLSWYDVFAFQPIIGLEQLHASTSSRKQILHTRLYDNLQATTTTAAAAVTVAPVYITIGPPCSGKTEALRAFWLAEGYNPDQVFSHDVAKLDEQSSVYHRVPLAAFLFPSQHLDPNLGQQVLKSGATVHDRLLDPSFESTDEEIRNVMLRIAGRITSEDFQNRTLALVERARDNVKFYKQRRLAIAYDLMAAVEQVAVQAVSEVICQMQLPEVPEEGTSNDELPYEREFDKLDAATTSISAHLLSAKALIKTPHVDVFVPQAIFEGGISKAEEQLQKLLQMSNDSPVAWCNTNTQPLEYATALDAAEAMGRPVKFVAWGTSRFPKLTRQELLRRNAARLRNTGRYIPAGAISAALRRVEELVSNAQQRLEMIPDPCPDGVPAQEWEEHKMDVALAALAGFHMDQDGFVVQVDEPTYFRVRQKKGRQRNNIVTASSGKEKGDKRKIRYTSCPPAQELV